jgi:uncharacterized protein
MLQREIVVGAVEPANKKAARPAASRAIAVLRAHRAELARMGVRHAWIFGSTARGDAGPGSDVDVLVDVDPEIVDNLFGYGAIQQSLEEWLGGPVDLADSSRLRPGVAAEAMRDKVLAF